MECVNNNRKLSDVDCRHYLAKDSIDHDFFDLDELEKTVNDLFKNREVNSDQISMIATCSSDNIICDEDNDIVVGRRDFLYPDSTAENCQLEEGGQSSAGLTNCIAFADPDIATNGDFVDNRSESTSTTTPTGAGDMLETLEEDTSFPCITPIPLENSDFTEVTPCAFMSCRSTPEIQDKLYFRNFSEAALDESKISLLVDALGALKLSHEFEARSSGLRRQSQRRKNLTFSNQELSRIERENEILLKKITAQARPRKVQLNISPKPRKTAASVNRLQKQQEIERQNYILFKKIQAAKCRKYSLTKARS